MSDPALTWVEAALEARFGLHIGATLRPRVRAAVAQIPREGCDSDQAWLERLVELATVQESYVFRHPKQIEAVVAHVRHRSRARIWSAACARGEEPLSLALALGPALSHVELLASDVSQAAIDGAREGIYRAWSLRTLDPHARDRGFVPQGGRFVARREWVERVKYQRINLACTNTPWPRELDVVLLRNVLLYFSEAQIIAVLRRVREVLRPDGLLVVSPAEAGLVAAHGWSPSGIGSVGCVAPDNPVVTLPEVAVRPPVVVSPRLVVPSRPGALVDARAAGLALARRLVRGEEATS